MGLLLLAWAMVWSRSGLCDDGCANARQYAVVCVACCMFMLLRVAYCICMRLRVACCIFMLLHASHVAYVCCCVCRMLHMYVVACSV